jgi:hypothetical protein
MDASSGVPTVYEVGSDAVAVLVAIFKCPAAVPFVVAEISVKPLGKVIADILPVSAA